jgi:DNA-binding SARP family transcriptional activator
LLSEVPPSRRQLSSLLFSEADDPFRALRWSLSELRRVLGPEVQLDGDPVALKLPDGTQVDVRLLANGQWQDAIELSCIGRDLLEGLEPLGSPHFESWLLAERRHVAAATEDVLHEACLAYLGRGQPANAIPIAITLVGLDPYVESHQALLIRAYALSGDTVAAEQQLQACTDLYAKELAVSPGPAVRIAATARPQQSLEDADVSAIRAVIEAGNAAVAAGAPEAGVVSLRSGVALADSIQDPELGAQSRLNLAEALVHSVRGDDEEGAELLHGAIKIAEVSRIADIEAMARAELGYIDMLAGRYDRAERWLDPSSLTTSDPSTLVKVHTYLGVVNSDRAHYTRAERLFKDALELAQKSGQRHREAYVMSMLGRSALLLGDLERASDLLNQTIAIAEADSWLAFLPWPQAFLGEVMVERGDLDGARQMLEQAFARACQIGDPCWEGVTGRGLALLAEADGEPDEAIRVLQDALKRCRRLPDTYKWAEVYILEAQCRLGVAHGHESAEEWIAELIEISSRTGMRELQLQAMILKVPPEEAPNDPSIKNLAESISNPRIVSALQT